MMRKNGPWTIKKTERKYQSKFIEVYEDEVIQPDGQPGLYSTVRMGTGVCILPLDAEGSVYLTEQFRYVIGQQSIEVVSGSVDEGETPEEAATRELKEEIGVTAEELINLGQIHMDTSMIHNPISLFLARGLGFTEADQEGTETLRPIKKTLDEAIEMVMKSEITHSPSCVLILKARNRG